MSEPKVVFANVSKSYPLYHHMTGGLKNVFLHPMRTVRGMKKGRFEALRNISFEVQETETIGIIGKNGAGKSTILGLIAGVLRPTRGQVLVRGRISPLLELGAGFHPELTGRENIILNGVLLGLRRRQILNRIERIIEFSEIGDFIHQPIRTYSSGMLARLGFSVIAHLEAEILLIDEVLAVGDMGFQQKCLAKIMEFKKSGMTIIFVSHSMADVMKICDRVAWIEDHSIRMLGPASEVISACSFS